MSFEVARMVHPNIPGSEHEVPAESLIVWRRSGWVTPAELAEMTKPPTPVEVKPVTRTPAKSKEDK